MIRKLFFGLVGVGMLAAAPAFAQSSATSGDASNNPTIANAAVASQTASAASTATVGIVSGAAGGAVSGGLVGGGGGGFTPAGGGGAPSTGGGPQSFLNSRDAGRAGGAGDKRFGAWMQGAYSTVDNTQVGLQFDGSVYNLVGGLDYMVNDKVVVGVALGYEMLDITTSFNAGSIEADGFGVTPYIGISLTNAWSLDAAAGYTWLSYDTKRNTNITASYDAERWFVASNLTGNYASGRWRLMPKVGVLYLEEESDAYRDSTGGSLEGSVTKLGRISAGGRVGYAFDSVMPYFKLMGEYDFEKNGSVRLGNGTFSHDDDMGGQVGIGFDFYGSNTLSGNVEASYNSLGRTDLDIWTTSARLRVKF